MGAGGHPLDQVARLKSRHRCWVIIQAVLGAGPLLGLANLLHPMVTDGYGRDLFRALLPPALARHYPLVLALALAALAVSEILRRRFHARHRDELEL